MNNTCGTCRHSSPNTPELECAKRPGWATWDGGACEDWAESNWQKYFGTPERTARTLIDACGRMRFCFDCPIYDRDNDECPIGTEIGSAMAWLGADAL